MTTSPLLARPTPRTSLRMSYIAPDALLRPCPQHLAPAHPIYDKQQALPFLDARAALINQRAQRRSSAESPLSIPRARLHAPQPGCATPPPCATPATFIPHPICRFPHLPPACDDDLQRSPTPPRCLPLSRSPNCHLHHNLRAQRSRSLSFIAVPRYDD
ncbi:hypothetical protein DFH08DRAFT_873888 [Mycena albidolilacea]|uniref:Uncharacterized protein n=1 Tax=Mycena albidolilacea TaxID=1033008 RepID=A0AAD6ZXC2_9AGAR|nr:hypothetical protein DFH08DRAFT_873888 [Mycena albidolilacea]